MKNTEKGYQLLLTELGTDSFIQSGDAYFQVAAVAAADGARSPPLRGTVQEMASTLQTQEEDLLESELGHEVPSRLSSSLHPHP